MAVAFKGVMQVPATIFKEDYSLDLPAFERMIDFNVRTGASAITWPNHKSESLSLTFEERKICAEVLVKVVARRVPVAIHVSCLAVEDTVALTRHAQKVGADGILAITPYFWKPTAQGLYEYFVRLGTSTDLPLLAYNSPGYLAGVGFDGELTRRLIERLPNFAGMKEASFNSETFLEIARVAYALRPDFSLFTGVEYLLPSVPLGGTGAYFAAAGVAPNLCTQLYEACMAADWKRARVCQYKISRLWFLFRDQAPSTFKAAMSIMGRAIGPTRPPLPTATPERYAYARKELEELGILDSEPHGW
jgi:dihydrodipicolinate synthase/N-acetylneuraminate lyase